ncbi:MAG: TMEM175 family protein [Alphaproteobacteria bacterium]
MLDSCEMHKIHPSLTRLEAFSDGVFAIAITLLVIEIKVPHLSREVENKELLSALLTLWPSYLGFLISFFTILIVWINHHRFFTYLLVLIIGS